MTYEEWTAKLREYDSWEDLSHFGITNLYPLVCRVSLDQAYETYPNPLHFLRHNRAEFPNRYSPWCRRTFRRWPHESVVDWDARLANLTNTTGIRYCWQAVIRPDTVVAIYKQEAPEFSHDWPQGL